MKKFTRSTRAITKMQIVALIVVIAVAGIAGAVVYYYTLPPRREQTILTLWTHITEASGGGYWWKSLNESCMEYSASVQNSTYIDIKGGHALYTGTGLTELITYALSNEGPDIVSMHTVLLRDLVDRGIIVEPPQEIQDYVRSNWIDWMVDAVSYKGKIWGIPGGAGANHYMLIYHKDRARQAGLDADTGPQTWAELREWANRLTVRDPGTGDVVRAGLYLFYQYPQAAWSINFWDPLVGFIYTAGGDIYDAKGNRLLLNSSRCIETIRLFYDMIVTDKSTSVGLGISYTDLDKYSMIICGSWFDGVLRAVPTSDWVGNATAVPLPRPSVYDPLITSGYTWGLFVTKDCTNLKAAWDFLKWYSGDGRNSKFMGLCACFTGKLSELNQPYMSRVAPAQYYQAFLNMMNYSKPINYFPHYFEITESVFWPALDDIFLGGADIKTRLDEAVASATQILQRED
ncbi:TPA: extracellular solute-binding protein [Candidatus Poribacteria bacterium]|nr:extracellular solute-binding protein [Candidatus Poribacteria bacterium]